MRQKLVLVYNPSKETGIPLAMQPEREMMNMVGSTRKHRATRTLVLVACALLALAMMFATGCSNQNKSASSANSTSAVSDVNDKASPQAETVQTENTGSTEAATLIENGNHGSSNSGQEEQSSGGSGTAGSGSSAGSSSSGSRDNGGTGGAQTEPSAPSVHEHNWYYGSETTILGSEWVCDKCGAHMNDTSGHFCNNSGCSYHQEAIYNEVPIRVCLTCGVKEYC